MSELKRYSNRMHGIHMDGTMDCMMEFRPKDGEWVRYVEVAELERERDEAQRDLGEARKWNEALTTKMKRDEAALASARAEIARLKALVAELKRDGFKILDDYEPKGEQEGTL